MKKSILALVVTAGLLTGLLAVVTLAQTKWKFFFEANGSKFYSGKIEESKTETVFEGKMVTPEGDELIHVFRFDCAGRRAVTVSQETSDYLLTFKTPRKIGITPDSAIEKAFEISCGREE